MITQKILPYHIVQHEELYPNTIDEYLLKLFPLVDVNISNRAIYPFELETRLGNKKINPYLRIAQPDDAPIIAENCKEVYEYSYPYKEMEDAEHIQEMILSSSHHFILFETDTGENAGCFRCALDFEQKKGYMGGFMVRNKFQGKLDVVRAIMGSYIWMWNSFKDEILVWYCENRTAHATSQYITAICGINTVAIFPNKDRFFGEIESDVMGIIYVEKVLRDLRIPQNPCFIEAVERPYLYSDKLYNLGLYRKVKPKIKLDTNRIDDFQKEFRCKITKDKYGYEYYCFSIEHSDSYFNFLHNSHIQNLEKAEFQVDSIEELYIFIQELKKLMINLKIRYCEVFVSAYNPIYQQLFFNAGFSPRGYVPCWNYNPERETFEDNIIFNYFEGEITQIDLLPQGYELLNCIEV
ncbi:MAG: hypothetical protein ACFFEY_14925 [Candidatus Thorarchaeota archaeon]